MSDTFVSLSNLTLAYGQTVLAKACAEAGILGAMPTLNARTPQKLRDDLTWIRERTDKAFALNLTIGLTDPNRLQQDMELFNNRARCECGQKIISRVQFQGNSTSQDPLSVFVGQNCAQAQAKRRATHI